MWGMGQYRVATFADRELGRLRVHAYLRDYNSQWYGYVAYDVVAETGAEAKRVAKARRRADELAAPTKKV